MHSNKDNWFSSVIDEIEASITTSKMDFVAYLTKKTYLGGKLFSFKGHEFQQYITELVRPGKKLSVTKCSQVGISEIFNRIALARARNRSNSGIIISFPTKTMAQNVLKTRFATVISESPDLQEQINPNVDNASMKAFRNGSIVYALSGGPSKDKKALLNIPADTLIVDERDRQDPLIVTGFRSRMRHTPKAERIEVNISTPTAAGIGIDHEISQAGEVHTAYVRCRSCKHEFIGDFFSHVRIPNYDGDIEYLTRSQVDPVDIAKAYLECPKCKANLAKHKRDWLFKIEYLERKDPDHIGVILDPFVAKDFIAIPELVEDYLDMEDETEFINQALGRVAKKSASQVDETKISIIHPTEAVGKRIAGLDMGKLCHFFSGMLVDEGQFVIDRVEIVKLPVIEDFVADEFKRHNYHAIVMDANPEHATAYKLVGKYPRMFTADYIVSATGAAALSMFSLIEKDKHEELVRLLHVNMAMAMDYLYNNIEIFHFVDGPYTSLIKAHLTSMRRIKIHGSEHDEYRWEKAAGGEDHFWHTLLYFFMASKVMQNGLVTTPSLPILVHKIRNGL